MVCVGRAKTGNVTDSQNTKGGAGPVLSKSGAVKNAGDGEDESIPNSVDHGQEQPKIIQHHSVVKAQKDGMYGS